MEPTPSGLFVPFQLLNTDTSLYIFLSRKNRNKKRCPGSCHSLGPSPALLSLQRWPSNSKRDWIEFLQPNRTIKYYHTIWSAASGPSGLGNGAQTHQKEKKRKRKGIRFPLLTTASFDVFSHKHGINLTLVSENLS